MSCRPGGLAQLGVKPPTEIRLRHLWEELVKDFCRDSLGAGARSARVRPDDKGGWYSTICVKVACSLVDCEYTHNSGYHPRARPYRIKLP